MSSIHRPHIYMLSLLTLGVSLGVGCSTARYTEVFVPEGSYTGMVIRSDAGTVSVRAAAALRVQRTIHGPEGIMTLSHYEEDGKLVLEARCKTVLPCAVDIALELPASMPVSIELGAGEVFVDGLDTLELSLGQGDASLGVRQSLISQVGEGDVSVWLSEGADARVTVGSGDIDVSVPAGAWDVDVRSAYSRIEGVQATDGASGRLQLASPAGSVTISGRDRVAVR